MASRRRLQIIAGRAKGRSFFAPARIRPTSHKVREAVFDILESRQGGVEGARFLDLFAGSGAMGLEALSRGAAEAVMVEKDPAVRRVAADNARRLGWGDEARVAAGDAFRLSRGFAARHGRFDVVFADPPYGAGRILLLPQRVRSLNLLREEGLLIVQHHRRERFEGADRTCHFGETALSFFLPWVQG